MGLPTADPLGVPIPLPEQVQSLVKATGLQLNEATQPAGNDDSDVEITSPAEQSMGSDLSSPMASACGSSASTSTMQPKKQGTCVYCASCCKRFL